MNYYILELQSGTKETGPLYPQIQEIGGTINANDSNSLYKVENDIPSFTPNLNFLQVAKHALLSDFLSASMIHPGHIVNEKVEKILNKFTLVDHKFYPTTLSHRKQLIYNYSWFIFSGNLNNYINFQETQFVLLDTFGDIENITINSIEELKQVNHEMDPMKSIRSAEYKFYKKINLDLFTLHSYDNRVIISESLKNEFTRQSITGIEMTEVQYFSKMDSE